MGYPRERKEGVLKKMFPPIAEGAVGYFVLLTEQALRKIAGFVLRYQLLDNKEQR